jgi:hypothetical protein
MIVHKDVLSFYNKTIFEIALYYNTSYWVAGKGDLKSQPSNISGIHGSFEVIIGVAP